VTYTVVFKGAKRALGAPRLSLRQRLELSLTEKTYVGHNTRSGWTGSMPFYA